MKTENKMKHTKGSWKIADKAMNRFLLTVGDYESCAIDVWGGMSGFPTIEEAQANAKLIAAAPDLLYALQSVFDFSNEDLEEWANGGDVVEITLTPYHVKRAISAIKNATE